VSGLSVAVLAGGQSTRMGRDKATLPIGGRVLLELVADRLRPLTDDLVVVSKRDLEVPGVRVAIDELEMQTPLAGVLTALHTARHRLVFVCACDMPWISPAVVRLLCERIGAADAAVPIRSGYLQSLHALWNTRTAEAVSAALEAGERSVRGVLEALDVRRVLDWHLVDTGQTFTDLDRPSDLERLLARRPARAT
jgi:molybdopterin-guanine dinucleotide biosynthesis protein A